MNNIDSRQAWTCAIWCGIATRMIRERLAPDHVRGPFAEKDRKHVRSLIASALREHPYLAEPAAEALAALGGP